MAQGAGKIQYLAVCFVHLEEITVRRVMINICVLNIILLLVGGGLINIQKGFHGKRIVIITTRYLFDWPSGILNSTFVILNNLLNCSV